LGGVFAGKALGAFYLDDHSVFNHDVSEVFAYTIALVVYRERNFGDDAQTPDAAFG
jgi:hypothetical protein